MSGHGVDRVDEITRLIDEALSGYETQRAGGGSTCGHPDCDCGDLATTYDQTIEPTSYSQAEPPSRGSLTQPQPGDWVDVATPSELINAITTLHPELQVPSGDTPIADWINLAMVALFGVQSE